VVETLKAMHLGALYLILLITLMTLAFTPKAMVHSIESPFIVPFVIGSNNVPIELIKVWNDYANR